MLQTIQNNAPKQFMTPENFVYWLQGLFELQPDLKTLTPEQVAIIKQHLMYVFEGKAPAVHIVSGSGFQSTPQAIPGLGGSGVYPLPDLGVTVC